MWGSDSEEAGGRTQVYSISAILSTEALQLYLLGECLRWLALFAAVVLQPFQQ